MQARSETGISPRIPPEISLSDWLAFITNEPRKAPARRQGDASDLDPSPVTTSASFVLGPISRDPLRGSR